MPWMPKDTVRSFTGEHRGLACSVEGKVQQGDEAGGLRRPDQQLHAR